MALVLATLLEEVLTAVGVSTTDISADALGTIQNIVQDLIEKEIDRTLPVTWHTEWFDIEDGTDTIFLKHFPVLQVAGLTNSGAAIVAADYHLHAESGYVQLADSLSWNNPTGPTRFFSVGKRKVQITYQAGYTDIPSDIQGVAINMVARRLGGSGASALSQERIGDYGYSQPVGQMGGAGGFTSDDLVVLDKYKKKWLFECW